MAAAMFLRKGTTRFVRTGDAHGSWDLSCFHSVAPPIAIQRLFFATVIDSGQRGLFEPQLRGVVCP